MSKRSQTLVEVYNKPEVLFAVGPGSEYINSFTMGEGQDADSRWHYLYSILEEVSTDQPKGQSRKTWKDFEHYKCTRSPESPAFSTHLMSIGGWEGLILFTGHASGSRFGLLGYNYSGIPYAPFGEPGMPTQGLPSFIDVDRDVGFVAQPVDFDKLYQRSLNTMLPKIKAELSAVNTLIELKDFRTLPQTISRLSSLVSSIGTSLAKPGTRSRIRRATDSLRRITGGASDGYLQLRFNILPLLSDISGIHAALSRTERRINDLVTRSGRVQTSHFGSLLNEYPDKDDEEGLAFAYKPGTIRSDLYSNSVLNFYRQVKYDPSLFHAELRYNYNYTQYQIEHAQLLGHLDAFGVNLNPSIIWNAIPWSFVVDWVIGVGRWLDQFKRLNMEPKINILGYLWSIKRSRRIYVSTKMLSLGSGHSLTGSTMNHSMVTESAYRRNLHPVDINSITTSGLSSTEVSLGAALVLSRRRHRKPGGLILRPPRG